MLVMGYPRVQKGVQRGHCTFLGKCLFLWNLFGKAAVIPSSLEALAGVAQWLSVGLQTERLLVWFPVRANAWVVGWVPGRGYTRGNHTLMFLSLSFAFSLSSPLSKNKVFFQKAAVKYVNKYWLWFRSLPTHLLPRNLWGICINELDGKWLTFQSGWVQ